MKTVRISVPCATDHSLKFLWRKITFGLEGEEDLCVHSCCMGVLLGLSGKIGKMWHAYFL